MRLLEEFWYGNIEPTEYDTNACKEYKEVLHLITRNEETQKEHTQRHQGEQPQKKILPFTASKVASSRNGMHLFNLI